MRWLRWMLALVALWCLLAPATAWAQNAPPFPSAYDGTVSSMPRGAGMYLSWIKIAVVWLVMLWWVSTTNWVNIDCQRYRLSYVLWNPLVVFPFFVAFIAAFYIPYFAGGLALLIFAQITPLLAYVFYRNARVEPHQKVLTSDHLRFVAAERLRPLGIKINAERKRSDQLGAPITLVAHGGATPADDNARYFNARSAPGFAPAKELVWDAISRRAESMMLDFTAQAMSIRMLIDGVWHNGDSRDRESGDAMLAVFKTLAALNPQERRARQQGKFIVQHEKLKYSCALVSQGTQTGERVLTQFDDGSARFKKLPDLGMRDKLVEQVRELLAQPKGILIFCAPPRGGLSALVTAALGSSDRFTRSYMAVEESSKKEQTTENVPVHEYTSAKGETPLTVLPKIARLYPDVLVVRELVNGEVVDFLCDQVEENRLVIGSVRAKEANEALLRVLMLKGSKEKFAQAAIAVVNQRLIRKLCETCKEGYPPPAQVLQQLRIPAGKVEMFYRPPQQPEQVCPDCGGIGYLGRTAIFEVLVLNDAIRQVLAKTPKLDLLRQESRKQGMRGLQEEGILLVARGVTSLQELMRVLKE